MAALGVVWWTAFDSSMCLRIRKLLPRMVPKGAELDLALRLRAVTGGRPGSGSPSGR